MILIDSLSYRSGLREINAAEKFLYAVPVLLICVFSRSAVAAAAVFFLNMGLTVFKGRISLILYLKLLLVPAVFLSVGAAAVCVEFSSLPGNFLSLRIFGIYLVAGGESIRQAVRISVTAMASVSCLYFLSLNTPVTDILYVLKRMHFPVFLTELLLLTYRFIFLILQTAAEIRTAQVSRLGNRDFRTEIRAFGSMGVSLFVLSLRKSEELYDAMESRCFDGNIRVLSRQTGPKRGRMILILAAEAALAAAVFIIGF